jgi:hypothetical protein
MLRVSQLAKSLYSLAVQVMPNSAVSRRDVPVLPGYHSHLQDSAPATLCVQNYG